MRAYSHQGHGPRADQTGRIHISDFRYPRTISLAISSRSIHLGHVWTAPWQELSDVLQHWSGAVTCPACLCGTDMAAGPNALRGSGPKQKRAL